MMASQTAVEALYSATYVETYLDSVENLPDSVQLLITRIREIDVQYRAFLRDVDNNYEQWSNCPSSELEQTNPPKKSRTNLMSRIQQTLIAAQELGDEKLNIVTQLQELIDHKTRQLDHDFKNLEIKEQRIITASPPMTSPINTTTVQQIITPAVISPLSSVPPVVATIGTVSLINPNPIERIMPSTTTTTTATSNSSTRDSGSGSNNNNNSSNNERTSKRARRTRTETNTSSSTPIEVCSTPESIVVPPEVQVKPLIAAATQSNNTSATQKKTTGGATGSKKKKRKTRGSGAGQQASSAASGNNTSTAANAANQTPSRDDTPHEEPIDPDEPTYCLCDQISFGEMILCDNDLCPIEWFHFSCVSLVTKPKGKWYCPNCRGDKQNVMKPKAQFLKELERYNKEKEEKT